MISHMLVADPSLLLGRSKMTKITVRQARRDQVVNLVPPVLSRTQIDIQHQNDMVENLTNLPTQFGF